MRSFFPLDFVRSSKCTALFDVIRFELFFVFYVSKSLVFVFCFTSSMSLFFVRLKSTNFLSLCSVLSGFIQFAGCVHKKWKYMWLNTLFVRCFPHDFFFYDHFSFPFLSPSAPFPYIGLHWFDDNYLFFTVLLKLLHSAIYSWFPFLSSNSKCVHFCLPFLAWNHDYVPHWLSL